jgi:hypothetical protein
MGCERTSLVRILLKERSRLILELTAEAEFTHCDRNNVIIENGKVSVPRDADVKYAHGAETMAVREVEL